MLKNVLKNNYSNKKEAIRKRLNEFKSLKEENYQNELLFCILTPQSNAKSCWKAVQELNKLNLKKASEKQISRILKSKTRFHNNKSRYIKENLDNWGNIKTRLNNADPKELRAWLADNVAGFGYKEAAHFLRNIGKSNNQIAILDRHILKNLKALGVAKTDKIKNNKQYLEIEQSFLNYSKSTGIPIDELDLLFWSQENGEIFK